jgi:hypothetical protein
VSLVPASEQSQVALVLGLGAFLDDLRVVSVEDMPHRCRLHTAARITLDPRDQTPGCAEDVLFGRRGLEAG